MQIEYIRIRVRKRAREQRLLSEQESKDYYQSKQMREIYNDYMNICKLIQHYINRHINKERSKATHYALFIIKGNYIVQDFEG